MVNEKMKQRKESYKMSSIDIFWLDCMFETTVAKMVVEVVRHLINQCNFKFPLPNTGKIS